MALVDYTVEDTVEDFGMCIEYQRVQLGPLTHSPLSECVPPMDLPKGVGEQHSLAGEGVGDPV